MNDSVNRDDSTPTQVPQTDEVEELAEQVRDLRRKAAARGVSAEQRAEYRRELKEAVETLTFLRELDTMGDGTSMPSPYHPSTNSPGSTGNPSQHRVKLWSGAPTFRKPGKGPRYDDLPAFLRVMEREMEAERIPSTEFLRLLVRQVDEPTARYIHEEMLHCEAFDTWAKAKEHLLRRFDSPALRISAARKLDAFRIDMDRPLNAQATKFGELMLLAQEDPYSRNWVDKLLHRFPVWVRGFLVTELRGIPHPSTTDVFRCAETLCPGEGDENTKQGSKGSHNGNGKQSLPSGSKGSEQSTKCNWCHNRGHIEAECRKKRAGVPHAGTKVPPSSQRAGERKCYRCQQPGHLAKDCPRNARIMAAKVNNPADRDSAGPPPESE